MLPEVVLIHEMLRSGLHVLVDQLGLAGHLRHVLEDGGVVDGLVAVLAPREGTVVLTQARGNGRRVDAADVELACDQKAGVGLIARLYLLR